MGQLVIVILAVALITVKGISIGEFFPFNGSKVCWYDTTSELVHISNIMDTNGVSIGKLDRTKCDEFRLSHNDDGSSFSLDFVHGFPYFTRGFRKIFVSLFVPVCASFS